MTSFTSLSRHDHSQGVFQGDAGATFVHKEIERVIDTASTVLFTFSIPERLLVLIGKSDPSAGDCGSVCCK